VLKRNCVSCVLLELRVIDLVARKDNHLRLTTLLDYPTRIYNMVLHKLVQWETFNVDCLGRKVVCQSISKKLAS
jgi:hypothetical protein